MNKTIIININSIVFHIEEDAYEILRSYMIDIKKHFGNTAESREILEDIENRIAEMFSEHIETGKKEVINLEDVQQVIVQMGRVSDFEESEETSGEGYHHNPTPEEQLPVDHFGKKLMRDPDDKVLGGVCSGLAHYFGMEPRWIRILLVLFVLIGGSGVLVYVVLWIIMPEATTRADRMAMRGEAPNLQNFKKSFDEEVKSFSDNFSGTGERISKGARKAGSVLGGCFGLIGKLIAWVMLINTGLSILSMFIFYIFNLMNLFGLENPIFFPPLEVLSNDEALVALTFGFLAALIPFLALFLLLIRILFKTDKMNNYAALTMFAVWILSIVGVIYYCVSASQDFREKSTINVQKNISKQDVYYFTEKDVRVLDASEKDSLTSKFNIQFDRKDLRKSLHSNIGIHFESMDSLEQPYIQYNYSAKGKSYHLAAERAGNIVYEAIQEDNKVLFPSHFMLKKEALDRDQYVQATVYLPIGAKVILMGALQHKLRSNSYHDCWNNYADKERQKYTEWTMTEKGLMCAQQAPVVEEEEQVTTENTVEAKNEQDSIMQIDGSNVTIQVSDKKVEIDTKKS